MLLIIRLYSTGDLDDIWSDLDKMMAGDIAPEVTPLYAAQRDGKDYISLILDVKDIDDLAGFFIDHLSKCESIKKTRTITLMQTRPLAKKFEKKPDGVLYDVRLKLDANFYSEVYEFILHYNYTAEAYPSILAYSFGDEDLIMTIRADSKQHVKQLMKNLTGCINGVKDFEFSKITKAKKLVNPDVWNSVMSKLVEDGGQGPVSKETLLILRLYPKAGAGELWADIEKEIKEMETTNITPLYASQREGHNYIALVLAVADIDKLTNFFVNHLAKCTSMRKTRTATLMQPTFLPALKQRRESLARFSVLIKIDPNHYGQVYKALLAHPYKDDLFPTYISYSFGEEDIVMSILASDRKRVYEFLSKNLGNLAGVVDSDAAMISKSMRLTTPEKWKGIQEKFYPRDLDKAKYDMEYDWSFSDLAALTGAMPDEL